MPAATMDSRFPPELLPMLQRDTMARLGLPALPAMRVRKTFINPYSAVHVLEFNGLTGKQRLFVKQPKSPTRGHPKLQARLLAEFQIMDRVHDLRGDEGRFCVAKPIGVYPDYPAIATLDAGNKTLRSRYANLARRWVPPRMRVDLLEQVQQCGLWLRAFQSRTSDGRGPFDTEGMIQYLLPRLQKLQSMKVLDVALAEGIVHTIRRLSQRHDAQDHPLVGRHNDFASHNILAEGERVCIIDFSMYDSGSFAHDPVNFWLELELLKLDPTYDAVFLTGLQNTFLSAFGQIETTHTAFVLARCQYTVTRLLTTATRSSHWFPAFRHTRAATAASLLWLQDFTGAAEATTPESRATASS